MLSAYGAVLLVFIVYWGAIEWLKARDKLEKHGISAVGPILMVRTKKGLEILEKLSKIKKFWRWFANLGIPAVFAGMFFMFILIIIMDIVLLTHPPKPSPITHPRNILLLPGINEYIPLVWGLIGLIVTLVVHEFSHAILCRVEGIKVKAMGILLALVPIGGFAEPDEKELADKTRTTRIQRVRIFSAGVISNFTVAICAFLIFFYLLGFLSPVDGVCIRGLYPAYPAEKAGLETGMIIFRIDDAYTPNLEDFKEKMSSTKPGDQIKIYVYNEGKVKEFVAILTKSPHGESGFLGVVVEDPKLVLQFLKDMPSYLLTPQGWLIVIIMPLEFTGFSGDVLNYFIPTGFWGSAGNTIFYLLNTFYWIGWINFYVGLFNCLPAIPLDGGRVFQETLSSFLTRRYGERGENMSKMAVKFMAFLIFSSILLSFVIPNIQTAV